MPSLMAILGLNISPFKTAANDAVVHAQKTGSAIASGFGERIGESLAAFATVAGLEETIRRTVEMGEKVYDLSLRLGMSTDAVQQWDFALKMSGSSIEQSVGFFEKLGIARQKAEQGSQTQIDAFKRLGVTIDDLKSKRIEDIAAMIGRSFEGGDPQKLIADLRTLGGRGAGEMAAAFRAGLSEQLDIAPVIDKKVILELKAQAEDAKHIWASFVASVAPLVAGLMDGIKNSLFYIATAFVAAGKGAAAFGSGIKESIGAAIHGKMPEMLGFKPVVDAFKAVTETFSDAASGKAAGDKERMERLGSKTGAGPLGESVEEDAFEKRKKSITEEAKRAEHILKLEEELQKKREANALIGLSAEDKLSELERRKAELVASRENALDVEEAIGIESKIEDLNREIAGAQKAVDKETTHRFRAPDVNALQRIGAYSAVGTTTIEGHMAKSEQHLAQIKQHLEHMDKTQNKTKY